MSERGSASVEFVLLSVVLFVPLVYVVLAVFTVQRAVFAVTAAAREAGRAYATAPGGRAEERARYAAGLALDGQLPGTPAARIELVDTGDEVVVSVAVDVRLPLAGRWATVPVTATHVATPDRYRAR